MLPHGAALAARGERGEQLGAVGVPVAALDFGELGQEVRGLPVDVVQHGHALRIQPQAASGG